MKRRNSFAYIVVIVSLLASAATSQVRTGQAKKTQSPSSTSGRVGPAVSASGATTPVTGSGSQGQLVKWTGANGGSVVGDSIITEDKFGKVGIGTTTPGSALTVQGMIETMFGGYKFPDGTVQTTASISSVIHDQTLTGAGTSNAPLGIAAGAVTASKIANGTVVRSLNGLSDQVTLTAGANITLTPSGNTITITAPNALNKVSHDETLNGDGSASSPLGLHAPLRLASSALGGLPLLTLATNSPGSVAMNAKGGDATANSQGAAGLITQGGFGAENIAGDGLFSLGGNASNQKAGTGSFTIGGFSNNGQGGDGLLTQGGNATGTGNQAGRGLFAGAGRGLNGATSGLAGEFQGNVAISGNLSKGGGSFKIDHPLDPENKYLYHSFVESPDMMNIYNGNSVTDENGEATVTLPDWFESLNQDFRYQLTVIGTFAQAIVAEEIKGNRFVVKTNAPNVKVSWQVTGIRHDAFANKHRIPVEEQKPEDERGLLLHPDAFNQPEEKGVQFVKIASHTERAKAALEQAKQQSERQ